ncbi:hypothetical protein CBS11852_7845 [Aspergillus niger]|nr:hypothetical protein CBS11852_7845 [Aspergillus niger]
MPGFDLMDIGNDVVFGNRSCLGTVDRLGRKPIVIKDGAMLGDRSVGLPRVNIGTRTMVGSGALLRRNGSYPDDRRSYCQRWQIQRTIDILIEESFGGRGIPVVNQRDSVPELVLSGDGAQDRV